jgi:predicted nucleic acid-binding protein
LADVAVVNASPLIYLTGAGQLDLLRLAGNQIVIPRAVVDEVGRWGADNLVARALDQTAWLETVPNPPVPTSIQAWDLGAGEAAVLSYALSEPAVAILDDRAGRRCALAHRIPLRGTLGLVLLAKKRGRIDAARPLLDRLRGEGMYLSDAVLNQALALVEE